jgi:HAD superfamily hydrolase (TIGR01509 family)
LISLVIFDCDGVLVDSEPIANRVFAEQLTLHGFPHTAEEVMRKFIGNSRDACIRLAGEMRGSPLPEGFARQWDDALHVELARGLRPVAGIPEVLAGLPVPYCVASNGEPEHMRIALTAAGLMPLVQGRLFSAALVPNPKPAPDVYLHAAKTMGVAPAHCVVVEDTPTGVRAGLAAGMRVFAYAGGPQTDRKVVGDLGATVFDDMRQLPRLLGFA